MILGDHSYDRSTVDRLSTRPAQQHLEFQRNHPHDLHLSTRESGRNQSFHTSYTTLKPIVFPVKIIRNRSQSK